jgi:hypothetical protein
VLKPQIIGLAGARRAWSRTLIGASLLCWIVLASACTPSGLFLTSSELQEPGDLPPDSTLAYSIFLIGDAGAPHYEGANEALTVLDSLLSRTGERSTVVFLGDNIYPSGLPPSSSPMYTDAQQRIDSQLEVVADHPGRVVFLPGNHDWGGAGLGGSPQALARQEAYVEAYLGMGNTFLPDAAFPGPVEVQLHDDIMLVVIDTQWWLEERKRYGDTGTYELEQEGEFLLELDDVLWRHADKHLVVVAHHPVFSNGEHGGFFQGTRSLLSGERIARGYLGTPQDLSNLRYRRLREGLRSIFAHHRDLVYAAGHDHNLQHFVYDGQHYVVSGSGSKSGHVEQGHGALFADERKGFGAIQYYTDGSIWLRFFAANDAGEQDVLYTHRIRSPNRPIAAYSPIDTLSYADAPAESSVDDDTLRARQSEITEDEVATDEGLSLDPADAVLRGAPEAGASVPEQIPYVLVADDTVEVVANARYHRAWLKKAVLGAHYRDIWTMNVRVPVIDLGRTAGGLTPLQKGGGLQTVSLRLQGADGDQYVLRSVDKDPTLTVPEYLRETIAHDVVQDQIAAMHPYGALILPRLARAAGIYHTSPSLVYIPDDPALGFYRPIFGGMLALFESRPDEDQSDEARFGFAENVVGTPKLIEEIEADNDERVDQRAFARARLFDMLIGDWDRHADQWRWSEFDRTPGKLYRPIPRDRDFAFFKFDGFLPELIKRSGNVRFRRFTNFFDPYDDMLGLNLNGAAMDQRFTSSLDRTDWLELADSIQQALTDEVIDEAVMDFPQAVYEHHGTRMADLLKLRRDRLADAASRYFDLLATYVDVVGTDKHERFEVIRLDDDSTLVILYKTRIEGDIDRELYRRMINTSETDEIRLYGLGGVDYFRVVGHVGRGPRVRAVGGSGEDTFVDSSSVSGHTHQTIFHDSEQGNAWFTSDETRAIRSDDAENNSYQMNRFVLDERRPLIHLSRNRDDGFLLGGGVKIITHGFRRTPFAAEHRLVATTATARRAINAHYRGHFVRAVSDWDAYLNVDAVADRRFENHYGQGNGTELQDRGFYRARIGRVTAQPSVASEPLPFTTVRFGPRFDVMNVERPLVPGPTLFRDDDFVDKYFVGARFEFNVDGTDTLAATEHGARWLNSLDANAGVRNTNKVFLRLASEISYFNTLYQPRRVTIGARVGAAANVGPYEFYQANTLGGQENLRGFRKTRFSGRYAAFTNLDVRVHLTDFNVYLMRGLAGVLGFLDHGRVWSGGEKALLSGWHRGYGGGVWIAPFNMLAFTATVGRSEENTLFDLTFGFQF